MRKQTVGWASRTFVRSHFALLLMLPPLVALHAQAVSVASVSSGVVDEQGAAISGSQVRMTAVDTGVVHNSVSNADGIECMAQGSF